MLLTVDNDLTTVKHQYTQTPNYNSDNFETADQTTQTVQDEEDDKQINENDDYDSAIHQINKRSTKPKPPFSLCKLPRKTLLILLYSTFNRLLLTYSIAIFNPIFPEEAKQKGLDSFEISFSFGILYAVVFFTAPLFGKYLVFIGPNLVFVGSLYIAGICNFLFVYLHYASGETSYYYFVFILLIRSLLALSYSGSSTVTQAIVSYEFREHIGKANGILQSGVIFGYVIGPAVSGFLYEAGGYVLPFSVIGGLDVIYGIIVHMTLPKVNAGNSSDRCTSDERPKLSICKMFRSPLVVTSMFCIISGCMGIANIDATLTLHLLPFGISIGFIGLIFALVDFVNAISNFFFSYVVDKFSLEIPVILFGHIGIAAGFFILGPSFFLTNYFSSNLTTIYIGLVLIGTGFGACLISLLKCMILGTSELGYDENDLNVMSNLSGLFNSIVMLGGFLGQFAIGIVASKYSSVAGYTFIGIINVVSFVIAFLNFVVRWRRKRR